MEEEAFLLEIPVSSAVKLLLLVMEAVAFLETEEAEEETTTVELSTADEDATTDSVELAEAEADAEAELLEENCALALSKDGNNLEEYHGKLVTVAVKAVTSNSLNKVVKDWSV